MKTIKKNSVVAHANQLTEARYSLSLGEQKVVLFLIASISPDDTELQDYSIKVQDFGAMMGLKGKSLYNRMDETLDKLMSRVIHIPKETGYLKIGWVSSAEYIKGKGIVQLRFDSKLKPYLLQLKEQFTRYRLFVVTQFHSAYSVRIYMLLKQYEKIGTREIGVQELRDMLGISDDKYAQFKDFRKWVLNQAKKEFDRKDSQGTALCDISFELETIREGRRITRLRFLIKKNVYQETLRLDMVASPLSDLTQLLIQYGINEKEAIRYIDQQGELSVKRCLEMYQTQIQKGRVQDLSGGYLVTMLNAKAGQPTQGERDRKLAENKLEAQEQKQRDAKALQKRREALGKEYAERILANHLKALTEAQKHDLLQSIRTDNPLLAPMMTTLESPSVAAILLSRIPNFENDKKKYIKDSI